VGIEFDPALNPGAPTYAGNAVPTIGTAGADGACAGLYCHGGNATANANWGGDNTSPKWDNSIKVYCGACHDANSVLAQGNHPAHLASAFGPGMGSTCYGTGGCHTDYALNNTTKHADGKPTFQTAPASGVAADNLAASGVCNNCHSTYTTGNVPTAGTTLAKAQWDNTSYKLPCVTCHIGGTGTQASVNIDNTGNRAHNIEGTYFASGHGLYGSPAPLACGSCHDNVGHIGSARPTGTNPWRLTATFLPASNGNFDAACANPAAGCHVAASLDHFWNLAKVESKSGTETHPTSTLAYPADLSKQRWYLDTGGNDNIVFSGDIAAYPHVFASGTDLVVCVSCHDPHGIGATAMPASVRTFSGANTEATDNNHMLRFNYTSGTPTALCAKCHK
jgi:predicted CxxxxCH...CXXCH cytochrome family protein